MPFMSLYVEELGIRKWLNYMPVWQCLWRLWPHYHVAHLGLLGWPLWQQTHDGTGFDLHALYHGWPGLCPNVFGSCCWDSWLDICRLYPKFNGFDSQSSPLAIRPAMHGYLSTGLVAGNLMGLSWGGLLARHIRMRTCISHRWRPSVGLNHPDDLFLSKEDFTHSKAGQTMPKKGSLSQVTDRKILLGLFVTSMIIQMAAQSVIPIMTLYIRHLGQVNNLMFVAGLITSAMGISSILSSGFLGENRRPD